MARLFAEQASLEVLRQQVISIAGKSDTSAPRRYRHPGILQFPHDDKPTYQDLAGSAPQVRESGC